MNIERRPIVDRAEWLSWRKSDLTASSVPALLGIHPYTTAYGLWLSKTGKVDDGVMSSAMRRGLILEDPVLAMLREERPEWRIEKAAEYYRDPSIRLGATPDAYVDDGERGPGLVQVKTAESSVFRKHWIDPETREVTPPLWIAVQATVEAHLTGRSWAVVAVLAVGFGVELHVVDIPLIPPVIERIRNEVVSFWRMVEEGRAPDPDYARDGKLIADLYREDNGQELDLSGDNRMPVILSERAELKARVSTDVRRIEELDAEIIGKLGSHERAYVPGWRIRRSTVSRAGYAVAPSTYRQLRINAIT